MNRRDFIRLLCAFVAAIVARVPLRRVLAAYREQVARAEAAARNAQIMTQIRQQVARAIAAVADDVSLYLHGLEPA